jgi:hypothetical protein
LSTTTALFTSSGDWRNSTNPVGKASMRDTRFPQILVGGPIPHHPFALGVSYSLYTDRDFTVVSAGEASPRGVPIGVHDTLSSRGGIDDLRIGGAWTASPHFVVGGAVHFLTGSNRMATRRLWDDTTYHSPAETAELSYSATSLSVGVMWQPVRHVELAAAFRRDGSLSIHRDSTGNGPVDFPNAVIGKVSMPTTIGGAMRLTPARRVAFSASFTSRNWSAADAGLRLQGAPGAENTIEVNAGVELFRDLRRPLKFPVRLGVRYATLPFPLTADAQPREHSISLGTGRRFAAERGGFDLAIERVWRSQGSGYTESATLVTIGFSVRPGGLKP